jgi:hypothetical protein
MIFYNYYQVRTFVILLVGFYLMLLPVLLRAEIVINEIMYDPEGSDTGREWIQVYNSGSDDIDLTIYKLLENGVNHKITNYNETAVSILKPGEFAIIADDPLKFLIDFPNFTGSLFDSAFSLNNTGEVLAMVNALGNIVNNFEYSVDLGAKNNGNSLQRANNGFWIEAGPTPAFLNKQESEIKTSDGDSKSTTTISQSSSSNSTHSGQNSLTKYVEKSQLEIGLGRDRIVSVNTPINFQAFYNTDKKPKFIWNFGDASLDKGQKTEHIYKKPGKYNVVLNAFLNGYQATARIKVTISDISVDILYITSGKLVDVMLKNNSDKEVNLGGFVIKMASNKFEIPNDTIIDAKSEIIIPAKYTNFETSTSIEFIKLYYPDGNFYKETLFFEIPSWESVSF